MFSRLQFAGMENSVHLLPRHLNCRHGAAVGFTVTFTALMFCALQMSFMSAGTTAGGS